MQAPGAQPTGVLGSSRRETALCRTRHRSQRKKARRTPTESSTTSTDVPRQQLCFGSCRRHRPRVGWRVLQIRGRIGVGAATYSPSLVNCSFGSAATGPPSTTAFGL